MDDEVSVNKRKKTHKITELEKEGISYKYLGVNHKLIP